MLPKINFKGVTKLKNLLAKTVKSLNKLKQNFAKNASKFKEDFYYLFKFASVFFTNFFYQFEVFLKDNGVAAMSPLFSGSRQSIYLQQF